MFAEICLYFCVSSFGLLLQVIVPQAKSILLLVECGLMLYLRYNVLYTLAYYFACSIIVGYLDDWMDIVRTPTAVKRIDQTV